MRPLQADSSAKVDWMSPRLRKYVVCWVLCIIVMFSVAIVTARATFVFIHTATKTSGRVIDLIKVQSRSNFPGFTYEPVFRFTAANGQSYTVRSRTSSNPPEFTVGQTVQVLYSLGDPAHARLNTTAQLWLVTIICTSIGMVFSVLGCVLFWSNRRYRADGQRIGHGYSSSNAR